MNATTVVSVSPHLRDIDSTARVMWSVFAALVPALAAPRTCSAGARCSCRPSPSACLVGAEVLSQLVFKREIAASDGSAAVTGLLLAFTCPPQTPLWMVGLGAFVAIFLVKQLFGGVGYNIFNPALAARAVMLASFPLAMTSWAAPVRSFAAFGGVDATAAASALGIMKEAAIAGTPAVMPYGYLDLLLGNVPGSLGETCKVALLLGAAFLFVRKIIDWRIPLTFLGSVALLSWIVGRDPLFELLSGGLILGAFFMATDYVTSPTTKNGRIIFGLGVRADHVPHPQLRRVSRGRVLRHPVHERVLAPDRILPAAPALRHRPRAQGGCAMKDVLKIAGILFLVCGLAAGSLSFVNAATKDRIAAFAKEEKIAALKKIFPAAEHSPSGPPRRRGPR